MANRAVGITSLTVALGAFVAAMLVAVPLRATDAVVMKAMQDELARSMKNLVFENFGRPYFISYRIADTTNQAVSASFGALLGSGQSRARTLTVEVRVGDYKLDNTNYNSPSVGQVVQIPTEDDYNEIRRQLWLATDAAYKRALEDLSRKKAALEAAHLADDTPDFCREPPTHINDDAPAANLDLPEVEKMVRSLSALFRDMPEIENSVVLLMAQNTHTLYLSSEGTTFTRTAPVVSFLVFATAQAPDGMALPNYESAFGRSAKELPSQEELARRIRRMGEEVKEQQAAPVADLYNGPMLVEARAAARLFANAFAGKLMGRRRPLVQANQPEDSFLDKVGARVLPEFLSVVDDPTRSSVGDLKLLGGYKADDEGVPGRETKLVEKGYLKTLLTTRNPVRGIAASTGNSRGSGPMPSNLIVAADKGLTTQEIRQQLIDLMKKRGKDYAIFMNGQGMTYKVHADGRQDLVRNAQMPSLNFETFRDILAATSNEGAYTDVYRTPTGAHLASFVVPSLLFEDVTVRPPTGEIPRLPIAKNPYFDK